MHTKSDLTVRQRFQKAIHQIKLIENSSQRQDSESYQNSLWLAIKEFLTIEMIVNSLSLFSSNEQLREINSAYLQFISIPYYQATLLMKYMGNKEGIISEKTENRFQEKSGNLKKSIFKISYFLQCLQGFGGILSKDQEAKVLHLQNTSSPTFQEILKIYSGGDAAQRRAEKISLYKEERALAQKLSILDEHYRGEDNDEDLFESMDEDIVRKIYVDQLKYHAFKSFALLEALAMEIQVLENRPSSETSATGLRAVGDSRAPAKLGAFDYTSRVEQDPSKQPGAAELINKLGRVLQPFVLTNKRNELREKVFGTGQVLPSMSVEEYLDYELANGKMMKPEEPQNDTDESDDSDEEIRQREWDDWKDDNPKGSGNMKANMG